MAEDFHLTLPSYAKASIVQNSTQSAGRDNSDPVLTSASTITGNTNSVKWNFAKTRDSSHSSQIWTIFSNACGGKPHYFNAYTSTNKEESYFYFEMLININIPSENFSGQTTLYFTQSPDGQHSVWWCGAPNLSQLGDHAPQNINAVFTVENSLPESDTPSITFYSQGNKSTDSMKFDRMPGS